MKQTLTKIIESGKRIAAGVAVYGTILGGIGTCTTVFNMSQPMYKTKAPYTITDFGEGNTYVPKGRDGYNSGTLYAVKVGPRVLRVTKDNLEVGMPDGLGWMKVSENQKYNGKLEEFAEEVYGGYVINDNGTKRKITPDNLLIRTAGLGDNFYRPVARRN